MKIILALGLFLAANSFALYPPVHHEKGLKRDHAKLGLLKSHARKRFEHAVTLIPASVDLSTIVSLPENQGQCGDCWNFSITKALRSAFMVAGKDPGQLSFNYLLNNCSGVSEAQEYGCNGGDFPAGLGMVSPHGDWLSAGDPYTAQDGSCAKEQTVVASGISWNVVGPGNRPPTFLELANALAEKHMLSVDVCADDTWSNYSSGIYGANSCGASGIDHMINVVGYDCETSKDASGNCVFGPDGNTQNHDGWLLAENNWGESWGIQASNGHGGYMKSRYYSNALADTAMFFEVSQPAPIPTPAPISESLPWWVWLLGTVVIGGVIVVAIVLLEKTPKSKI